MNWLLPALLAPAAYTVNVFVDKYILEKEIKDYLGLPIFTGIVGFIFGIIFWFGFGMPISGFFDIFLILLSGMFTLWGLTIYFKALTSMEASLVNLLIQVTPVFVLVFSFLLLKENISQKQLLGFFLIIIATVFGSLGGEKVKIKFSASSWWMIVANIFFALAAVVVKFALEANSFTKIVTFESFGVAIGGLMLFIFFSQIREAFFKNLENIRVRALGLIFLNEAIFVFAKALSYFAYSLGPVALVSIVGGTQALYGILYGWILALVLPRVFKEDVTRRGITNKLIMTILILGGLFLVNN